MPDLRLEDPEILINAEGVPLHAGLAFGGGIALMLWLWVNRDPGKCLLTMALILIGWLVAVNTANDVFSVMVGSDLFGTAPGAKANREIVGWLVGGFCGGAVGAGFTAFAAAIPAQAIRHFRTWALDHRHRRAVGAPALPRCPPHRHRASIRAMAGCGRGRHSLWSH